MTRVLLNSGGMDSFFVALQHSKLLGQLTHVFVDVGQKYVEKERKSAWQIANFFGATLHDVKGAQIGTHEHSSGIIPFRNAELILSAAQYGEHIYLGILSNEVNSDKSPEFLKAMKLVLDISCRPQYWSVGRTFTFHTPLGIKSKTELVRNLYNLVLCDTSDLHWVAMMQTVSCYAADDKHCGRCPSCFKRWVALTGGTGLDYSYKFLEHPAMWHPLTYWEAKDYADERIQEIRDAYAV